MGFQPFFWGLSCWVGCGAGKQGALSRDVVVLGGIGEAAQRPVWCIIRAQPTLVRHPSPMRCLSSPLPNW